MLSSFFPRYVATAYSRHSMVMEDRCGFCAGEGGMTSQKYFLAVSTIEFLAIWKRRETRERETFVLGTITNERAERRSLPYKLHDTRSCDVCVYVHTRMSEPFVALHYSRIAREIGECPRNNLCCLARTAPRPTCLIWTRAPRALIR